MARRMLMIGSVVAVVVVTLASSPASVSGSHWSAAVAPPMSPTPPHEGADGHRTRRPIPIEGAVEIALGSLGLAVGAVLIGNGAWELVKANELAAACDAGSSQDPLCDQPDPVRGHHVAAGLSFAFVVPVVVAAAFALAHGIRKNREARRRVTARWTGSGFNLRF